MKADCRNDCKLAVAFPETIYNRPGLPRIGYRIGSYSDFREALFHELNRNPVLAPFTYRNADDPAIALLEGAAILGDILSFYQEVYANELYHTTATLPASIAGLVRLVGYRLSPAVGGHAVFAFEVSGDAPVVIPAGFPVTADVTGLPDAAEFETEAEITARPALSRFSLYRPFTVPAVSAGATRLALNTAQLQGSTLEKGDRSMLVAGAYHQVAVVDAAEPRFEETEVTIKGSWRGPAAATVTAYKLGRDFHHFGYNAPPMVTEVKNNQAQQTAVDFFRLIVPSPKSIGGSVGLAIASSSSSALGFSYDALARPPEEVPLDSQVDDLSAGTTLLIVFDVTLIAYHVTKGSSAATRSVLVSRQVTSVRNTSLTHGALTGPSTVVALDRPLGSVAGEGSDIRTVQVHEVTAGPLTLTGVRTPVAGAPTSPLFFFGNGVDYQALDGRALQLQRRKPAPGQGEAVEQLTGAISASAVGDPAVATLRPLTLQPAPRAFTIDEFPLSFPPEAPPVVVYGNLAAATQGKTESEVVLGNGDARAIFQTFPVPKAPLTYLVSKSETPPEVPELTVRVEGLEWKRVASLIGHGAQDQVYVVREDQDGQSYIQFGDGETGARLPSGVGNVTGIYRTGVSAYGPLKPGTSAEAGATAPGLEAVTLIEGATGGAASEDPEKARVAAPGRIQSLGRLVSLRDFETETLGIPGVSAVSAAWEPVGGVPVVVLTVLMETGRAAELAAVTELLGTYNVCRGPQRHAIMVRPGARTYLYIDAVVALAPSYVEQTVFEEVRNALAALFSTTKRRFGELEYRSRIEAAIQDVTGVLWNTVTGLGGLGPADDPAILTAPPPPRPITPIVPCGAEQLLALHPTHLTLSVVATPAKVCE